MITTSGMLTGFSIITAIAIVIAIMMIGSLLKDLRRRQTWVWLTALIVLIVLIRTFEIAPLPPQ